MKPSRTMHRKLKEGFTLIELLVVITIIAVLASAGFTVGIIAVNKARKASALATITSIESAVAAFYSDYGALPVQNIAADDTEKSDNVGLLKVLLGKEASGSAALNTRAIKYLDVQEGKPGNPNGKNGLIYTNGGATLQGLYDPWGGTYSIKFDGNSDGQIDGVKTDSEPTGKILHGKRAAIWSNGGDGVNGGGSPTDDVRNWQH